jgi:hypothetical protein
MILANRPLISRTLALSLSVAMAGVPALAAAGPPLPVAAPDRPIAASAARAAMQAASTDGRTEMSPALKWTGFGLIAGGASMIALGAVIDDTHCFDYAGDDFFDGDSFDDDCETAKTISYWGGGVMAGVGVGLLIMAHASRRPVSPTVTMRRGRLSIQQTIRF